MLLARPRKNNLAFYGRLPFYNKLFHNSGFVQEAAALAKGDATGTSDRMAEEVSLIGPPSRCREQLAAFREAGVQLPISRQLQSAIRPMPRQCVRRLRRLPNRD